MDVARCRAAAASVASRDRVKNFENVRELGAVLEKLLNAASGLGVQKSGNVFVHHLVVPSVYKAAQLFACLSDEVEGCV